eukprot:7906731-Alexandrium_andersonii.AAC.1
MVAGWPRPTYSRRRTSSGCGPSPSTTPSHTEPRDWRLTVHAGRPDCDELRCNRYCRGSAGS